MQWLAGICVRRPVFASVLILSLTVVGAFSFGRLGVDRFPKIDFPTIVITTRLPGATPEQVETEISDKIEEAVNTISGIDELRSTSAEGVSLVVVTFLLDKDTDVAAQEVRDRVNRALPLLPRRHRPADRREARSGCRADPHARGLVDAADPRRHRVRGQGAAPAARERERRRPGAGRRRAARARSTSGWTPARLRAYNITVTDVSRALRDAERRSPGRPRRAGPGDAVAANARARRDASRSSSGSSSSSATATRSCSATSRASRTGWPTRQSVARVNGLATVVLLVRRQSGTNTVEVVKSVKQRLDDVEADAAGGYDVRVVRDQSEFIEASIQSVEEHLVVGAVLAALVVLLFLGNWRSTIIASIAIPTSIIATFGLIWYMGFTLNSMTMLGLTLAVGIVIDDAIVVLENICRFIEEKDYPPFQAAIEATREIGLAVLATTLSLVAIFLPVAFMGGIVGRFMKSFGFTMAFAIVVSLLVSFTLTPMMSARLLKRRPDAADGAHGSKDSHVLPSDRARLPAGARTGRWRTAAWWWSGRSPCCCRAFRCSSR